jgi:hypothetical protein
MQNINIPIKCPKCNYIIELQIKIKNPAIRELEEELGLIELPPPNEGEKITKA